MDNGDDLFGGLPAAMVPASAVTNTIIAGKDDKPKPRATATAAGGTEKVAVKRKAAGRGGASLVSSLGTAGTTMVSA